MKSQITNTAKVDASCLKIKVINIKLDYTLCPSCIWAAAGSGKSNVSHLLTILSVFINTSCCVGNGVCMHCFCGYSCFDSSGPRCVSVFAQTAPNCSHPPNYYVLKETREGMNFDVYVTAEVCLSPRVPPIITSAAETDDR